MTLIEVVAKRVKQGLRLTDDSPVVCAIRPRFNATLERFYGRRGLSRTIHGEKPIRLLPCARLLPEEYEPQVLDLLKQKIAPGAVVLDVGASVGICAMMMARWCGRQGHIHAFEPSPTSKRVLTEHLRMNGLADRVTVNPVALSDKEGAATFHAVGISGKSALSDANLDEEVEHFEVPITTVDAYCQLHNIKPSLIKIDVEGFEFSVLNGAKNTLRKSRPSILVELHPMNWPSLGIDPRWAEAQLTALDCKITPVEYQHNFLSDHGHIMLEPLI